MEAFVLYVIKTLCDDALCAYSLPNNCRFWSRWNISTGDILCIVILSRRMCSCRQKLLFHRLSDLPYTFVHIVFSCVEVLSVVIIVKYFVKHRLCAPVKWVSDLCWVMIQMAMGECSAYSSLQAVSEVKFAAWPTSWPGADRLSLRRPKVNSCMWLCCSCLLCKYCRSIIIIVIKTNSKVT